LVNLTCERENAILKLGRHYWNPARVAISIPFNNHGEWMKKTPLNAAVYACRLLFLGALVTFISGQVDWLTVNPINSPDGTVEEAIPHWVLIGPFKFSESIDKRGSPSASRKGLNHDFLSDIGYPEQSLSKKTINDLCSGSGLCSVRTQKGDDLIFDQMFPSMTYAAIYAAASVMSTQDTDVGLELGSDDGAKVWVNGTLLLADPEDTNHAAFKYTHLLTAHLKKGSNLLVVKVDQKIDTWALITSFLSLSQMRQKALEQADWHLLGNRLMKAGDSLDLTLPGMWRNSEYLLTIGDWSGRPIISMPFKFGSRNEAYIRTLQDGYYNISLRIGAVQLHDAFYIGNPATVYENICKIHNNKSVTSQQYLQLDPLIQRYRILMSSEHFHPLNADWQKKMLSVLQQGAEALHHPTDTQWQEIPGMHLREFISGIDGTPQNYLFFVPEAVRGPLALVIIMPYAEAPQRPFLESSLIAWPDDLEDIRHAANANGIAVAVINGRGTVGDAPIGEEDAFEVLHDIENNYSINQNRLYLYGTCEGGRRALLLAEHNPQKFAAVGVYGPLLSTYDGFSGINTQGLDGSVFSMAELLSNTPVLLVQGEFDDRSSIAVLKEFYEELGAKGSPSQLDIIPDGMHKQRGVEDIVFPFLARFQKR
jgi:Prolyl oligopeptidase family